MTPARYILIMLLLGVAISTTHGQTTTPATPATPKKFKTRDNGSSTGAGSSVGIISSAKKPKTRTITITYTVITKEREWENTDGKKMKARLLVFPSLDESENAADKNDRYTVIRDQKVRFLMSHNNRPTIYPLEKLSDFDREYIEEVAQAAAAAKAAASKKKNSDKESGIQTEKPEIQKK